MLESLVSPKASLWLADGLLFPHMALTSLSVYPSISSFSYDDTSHIGLGPHSYDPDGRKRRGTKEPLDESERRVDKLA